MSSIVFFVFRGDSMKNNNNNNNFGVKQSIIVLFLLINLSLAQAHDGAKIAVVDLERVVILSPQGKALQSKLEKFQEDVRNEAEGMNKIAQDIRRKVQEGANSLSEDKLAELQRQFEDQSIKIRRFSDEKQREGQKMQQQGLKDIEKELEPVMKQIQTQHGFDLILNNTPGIVVMTSEKVDITQLVIETLKQNN